MPNPKDYHYLGIMNYGFKPENDAIFHKCTHKKRTDGNNMGDNTVYCDVCRIFWSYDSSD